MIQLKKSSQSNIPGYLEDLVGAEKLTHIFSLIDQNKPLEEIIASGVLDRQAMAALLVKLLEKKVLISADTSVPDDKLTETITAIGKRCVESPILLVTDSASDIPPEIARERNIVVIPLTVSIGGKEYRDGVDISSEQFYELLEKSKTFPVTNPPSEADFQRVFNNNIADKDILGIFISKKMSETVNIARQAKMSQYNSYLKQRLANPNMPKKVQMEFIDSRMVSMGTTLLVMEASEKIRAGWSFAAIKDHIEKLVNEVRVFFMVDNLDYLVRGGRIGRGSAMFGKLFGFKPILDMVGGGVNAKGRTIGGRRAQQKMIEFMRQEIGDSNKALKVGICHASAPKKAEKIKQLVEGSFPNHDHVVSYFGPIVGAHTGPGAVGVAYLALPED
ncbi:DegV family protein [Desulfosediminicola flagellatus]|uniref:DegV family protein n=1 Tax=Desulfosediminicola flagellatus TaxID=2569541 RepID=UPI0010ABF364|nr:DegV family protein [Desulfosediminicola flagellatus]